MESLEGLALNHEPLMENIERERQRELRGLRRSFHVHYYTANRPSDRFGVWPHSIRALDGDIRMIKEVDLFICLKERWRM